MVSVIIPFCNQMDTLGRALESVRRQTYSDWEVLCIDDGSAEDVMTVIPDSIFDEKIICYRLPHGNANIARNYGILRCSGEYIAMLDADDEWRENHLEESLELLKKSGADGVYGSLFVAGHGEEKIALSRSVKPDESFVDFVLSTGCGAQTSTLVMTAESAKSILWDESLFRHQDYDFVVRYSKVFKWECLKEPTVIYYQSCPMSMGKNIDFTSCIRFIERNKADISPRVYVGYNRQMFHLAIACDADNEIISYYHAESILAENKSDDFLESIINGYFSRSEPQTGIGLFNGKMGKAIFFFLCARYKHSVACEEFAESLLDDVCEEIHLDMPVGLEDGLCGIGWGMEYLAQQGCIKGDTDEILEDIEVEIMKKNLLELADFSLETGLTGILLYALMRLSSPCSQRCFDETYKLQLQEICDKYPSRLTDQLSDVLAGKHLDNYPYWKVFSYLLPGHGKIELWKKGLDMLVYRNQSEICYNFICGLI